MRQYPLVDPVVQEEDLDPLLAEHLQVRAAAGGGEAVGGDVVDLLLPLLHPRGVVGERDRLLVGVPAGRGEPEQPGYPLPVRRVLARPLLEDESELPPEAGVLLRPPAGRILQQAEDPLDRFGADGVDVARLLEDPA